MRLISQDGMIDIPYEHYAIYVEGIYGFDREIKECVANEYQVIASNGNCRLALGHYSTKEKALRVMGMLQQAYIGRNEALDLEMAEETDEELKNIMLRHGFGTLFVTRTNLNPQAEFKPLHSYFKFPADEEVEIANET